jgi:hypothetical protein
MVAAAATGGAWPVQRRTDRQAHPMRGNLSGMRNFSGCARAARWATPAFVLEAKARGETDRDAA